MLTDAQRLLRFGEDVTGIRLALNDPLQAPTVVRSVANAWGGGVYVTEVAGLHSGVNPVTGRYSVGATGKALRGGVLAEPLRETFRFLDLR